MGLIIRTVSWEIQHFFDTVPVLEDINQLVYTDCYVLIFKHDLRWNGLIIVHIIVLYNLRVEKGPP